MKTHTLLDKLNNHKEKKLEDKASIHSKKSEVDKQLIADYYNEILENSC
jgi:hypothetical protein